MLPCHARAILYKSKQSNQNELICALEKNPWKPGNMGTNELPWTPTSKIWHFELTQDHLDTEDTEGNRRSLCLFFSKPLQYGCLWTPLDPHIQDLTFWADSGPWGYAKVTLPFLFQTPTILVSMDSPGPQQTGFDILSWLKSPRTLRTPRVPGGHCHFCSKPLQYVYGAVKIQHFELTQDTEGVQR